MATAALQPLEFYSIAFPNSPNPWKVAIVLEELHIPYNIHLETLFSVKKKPFTDLNPNGRTPVVIDPNNGGLVLWEVSLIPFRL
jgi:glutathione S-transferase